MTALNASGVESLFSNEAGLGMFGSSNTLVASATNGRITLSWSPVAGAVSYRLRRSSQSLGPYGEIASNIAGSPYNDTTITDGVTYYYVFTADLGSGRSSEDSNEASAVAVAHMNLEVPIELTDSALASDVVNLIFERTRTSFDLSAYDGTVQCFMEIIAMNTGTVGRSVSLVSSAGIPVGVISVPANTLQPTRIRALMNPNSSADNYRLALQASSAVNDVQVLSARMLVQQTAATRTRIYIPLLASAASPSRFDAGAGIDTTAQPTYLEIPTATLFTRDSTAFSALNEFNAWELEVLVSGDSGAAGSVGLYNVTQGSVVLDTESVFSGGTVQMINSPIDEGVNGFGAANEGDQYEVALKCDSGCSGGLASIYKAGLWVTLNHLSLAEIPYRSALSALIVSSAANLVSERTWLDLSRFSNPVEYFQATGKVSVGGAAAVTLGSAGSSDSSSSGFVSMPASQINFVSSTKSWGRTGVLGLTSGDRWITQLAPSSGGFDLLDASIVVRTAR